MNGELSDLLGTLEATEVFLRVFASNHLSFPAVLRIERAARLAQREVIARLEEGLAPVDDPEIDDHDDASSVDDGAGLVAVAAAPAFVDDEVDDEEFAADDASGPAPIEVTAPPEEASFVSFEDEPVPYEAAAHADDDDADDGGDPAAMADEEPSYVSYDPMDAQAEEDDEEAFASGDRDGEGTPLGVDPAHAVDDLSGLVSFDAPVELEAAADEVVDVGSADDEAADDLDDLIGSLPEPEPVLPTARTDVDTLIAPAPEGRRRPVAEPPPPARSPQVARATPAPGGVPRGSAPPALAREVTHRGAPTPVPAARPTQVVARPTPVGPARVGVGARVSVTGRPPPVEVDGDDVAAMDEAEALSEHTATPVPPERVVPPPRGVTPVPVPVAPRTAPPLAARTASPPAPRTAPPPAPRTAPPPAPRTAPPPPVRATPARPTPVSSVRVTAAPPPAPPPPAPSVPPASARAEAAPRVATASATARVTAGLYGDPSLPKIREGAGPKPRAAAIQLGPQATSARVIGEGDEEAIEIGDAGEEYEAYDDPASDADGGFRLAVDEADDDVDASYDEPGDMEVDGDEPHDAGEADHEPVAARVPTTGETAALLVQARLAVEGGDLGTATQIYSDLIDLAPDHLEAHIGRGRLFLDLGDFTRAMSDFMAAEDAAPQSPEPQIAIGDMYFARKDYRKAITYFDAALEVAPNHGMAWCRRGISHYYRKNPAAALTDLQRAKQLDPDIPNIDTYLAMVRKKAPR